MDPVLRRRLPFVPGRSDIRTFQQPGADLPAILHCNGHAQSVVIRTISRTGMNLEYASGLKPGDSVRVQLFSTRTLAGAVVWSVADYCGIAFQAPLADDDPALSSLSPPC